MQWTNKLLYAHFEGLAHAFSFKRAKSISLDKIPELSKKSFESLAFRKNADFLTRGYIELTNLLNSGTISLRMLDLYFLGEFVRTNSFPNVNSFNNLSRLKSVISFYNSADISAQIDKIVEKSNESNSKFAKFTKTAKSVFEVNNDQTNILYNMLKRGEICIYVYAYFMKIGKFSIDYTKLKNVEIYRDNKIAEYVAKFDLSEIQLL